MAETTDGFEIARRDLEIRGPGEFMGARQSGAACCASPTWQHDMHLLEEAKAVAPCWLQEHPPAPGPTSNAGWTPRQEFSGVSAQVGPGAVWMSSHPETISFR